jgi:Winged helix DNA-binding domain
VTRVVVSRGHLLAYRAAVHDLGAAGDAATVLDVGLQDYPPGRSALLALRLRTQQPDQTGSAIRVLIHSLRGAMHLHHANDLPLFAAALRHGDGTELAKQSIGPFGTELAEAGIGFDVAMDEVATAMRDVMSDAEPRTKGELSGAVSPMVRAKFVPWCTGCGVHHVHDALFRYATLQAGLMIEVESPSMFRFRPSTVAVSQLDPQASRAELVRRFLHAFGPAGPAHLAAWLALTPAAARCWWELVAPELLPVSVDGTALRVHSSDLSLLESPPDPPTARLLPPYDPLTELADRRFLLPDSAERRQVWTPAANPGVLLIDGEIAGTWRQRSAGSRLTLTITSLRPLPASQLNALKTDARTIADYFGACHYDISCVA